MNPCSYNQLIYQELLRTHNGKITVSSIVGVRKIGYLYAEE